MGEPLIEKGLCADSLNAASQFFITLASCVTLGAIDDAWGRTQHDEVAQPLGMTQCEVQGDATAKRVAPEDEGLVGQRGGEQVGTFLQ